MGRRTHKEKREAELLAHYLQIIADKRTPARTRVLAGYAVMWLDGKITKPEFLALNRRANERPTTTASTDKRLTKIREAAEDENRDGEENDDTDAFEASVARISAPVVPAPVKTPEELAEERRLQKADEDKKERNRVRAAHNKYVRGCKETITRRDANLPQLKAVAQQNMMISWTTDYARRDEAQLFVDRAHPAYDELHETGRFQARDSAGKIATLTTSGQHAENMMPPGRLRIALVEASQLDSLPPEEPEEE